MDLSIIKQPLPIPDLTEIKEAQAPLMLKASEIIIRNVEQQENALELLRDIRTNIKAARAKFKLIKDPMNAAKEAVLAWEHEVLDPWEAAEKKLSNANSDFILEQKRLAQQEADRKARELREQQQAEALAKSKALEETGDIKGAISAAVEAEKIPVPVVAPEKIETARVVGVSSRVSYSCEVTDLKALAEYCLANPALLELYLLPNTTALNGRARASKTLFDIPGCKLIEKYV